MSEKWSERLTRAAQGSCGVHQIAAGITASRYDLSGGGVSPTEDHTGRFTPLRDSALVEEARQFETKLRGKVVAIAHSLLKEAFRGLSQSDVRIRINRISKALKTWWLGCIGAVPEGIPAVDSVSREESLRLKEEAKEVSSYTYGLCEKINSAAEDCSLTPAEQVNLGRIFSFLPIPAQTEVTCEDVEAELSKQVPVDEDSEGDIELFYLRASIKSQARLRALAQKANIPLRDPSYFSQDGNCAEERGHWAAGTSAWKLLSEQEREDARAVDFTSHVPLVSWFIAAPIAVADKSVLNPKATEGEFEKKLEILQSLKEAPLLFGMDAEELEQSLNSDCAHWLSATKKPESGKFEKPRLFTTASASLKAGFRQFDANARLLSSLEAACLPGKSSAVVDHELSKHDDELKKERGFALTLSADVSAWSTNHKRFLVKYQHRMLGASVGLSPDLWEKLIDKTAYHALDPKTGKRSPIKWEDGTFQGFSVFSDTSLHKALWDQLSALKTEGVISQRIRSLIYMDDVISSAISATGPLDTPEKVAALKSKILKEFEVQTGMLVDSTKSVTGFRKWIFLNKIYVSGIVLPSFTKLLTRPKVLYGSLTGMSDLIRSTMAFSKDLFEARMNPFLAYALQSQLVLCFLEERELNYDENGRKLEPLETLLKATRPLSLKGLSAMPFRVLAKVQSKDTAAEHIFDITSMSFVLKRFLAGENALRIRSEELEMLRKSSVSADKEVAVVLKILQSSPARRKSPQGYSTRSIFDAGVGCSDPRGWLTSEIHKKMKKEAGSPLWRDLLTRTWNDGAQFQQMLLDRCKGMDGSLVESIRSVFPDKVLREFLGKLTSERLLRELFRSGERISLKRRYLVRSEALCKKVFQSSSNLAFSTGDMEAPKTEDMVQSLENLRLESLNSFDLNFKNLAWPHPGSYLLVDTIPQGTARSSWNLVQLPEELSIFALTGPGADSGSYLGEDEGRDERGGRGGRRDERYLEAARRRQPRSRSERIAARSAASTASAGARTGRSREPPAVTRETRHLAPRGPRAPPMTVGDATCFWLHTMGLRDGPSTNTTRALDPANHAGRARALREVRAEDVVVVMTGLLRTMAMLMVELSQLMMLRIQPMLPNEGDEEVEVEVDDEEMWMQTNLQPHPKKRQREPEEAEAEEERLYREDVEKERAAAEAQQMEREQEEMEQSARDEELYRQHQAAVYRDWEWWLIQNPPSPMQRRLRTVVTLTHGNASECLSSSVPLVRGQPVEIHFSLTEQQVAREIPGDRVAPTAEMGSDPGQPDERLHHRRYVDWCRGLITNHEVVAELGDTMLDMFWSQWLVETDEVTLDAEQATGEGADGAEERQDSDEYSMMDSCGKEVDSGFWELLLKWTSLALCFLVKHILLVVVLAMARSTFAVALVVLMLPATARRNKDDLFTMEAGNSEAGDLQAEIESWLSDRWSVGLSPSDAQWWAKKESWYMETCGATLPYLKKLYSVLSDRLKMAYPPSEAVKLMFEYAKKQLDPDQLFAMYSVLVDRLRLSQQESRSRAPELLEKDAASAELSSLYSFLVDGSGMRIQVWEAQKYSMTAAAAGCEA
ncbi:unnamed protein product, partial [Symbiodinium sp. KB8]